MLVLTKFSDSIDGKFGDFDILHGGDIHFTRKTCKTRSTITSVSDGLSSLSLLLDCFFEESFSVDLSEEFSDICNCNKASAASPLCLLPPTGVTVKEVRLGVRLGVGVDMLDTCL